MLQKWKVGGTVIWAKSDALAVCLGVPQKRLSKSSYKTNIILTFSVQRPSHVPTCVSRCSFAFGKEMKKLGPAWPISRRRSSIWKVLKGIWTYAHRCLVKQASLFLSRKFNGIDKIVGRFKAKADRRKSPKSKLNLSMPKRTPKWRSPNIGERKLKWVITVRRLQISSKCYNFWEWKITASPNTWSSECARFP